MPVIKAQQAGSFLREATVLDLGDVAKQAARMRAAAEAKARKIIEDAQAEAARLVAGGHSLGLEQGRKEGVAKGLEEGRKQGHAEALAQSKQRLDQLDKSFTAVASTWEKQSTQLHADARPAVLNLAVRVAELVVHRIVQVDRTVIEDQLANVLNHVLAGTEVSVQISPDDRAVLEEAMPRLVAEFRQFKHIRLVDDAQVKRGGCVVVHAAGQVDARLDTQLERIVALMLPDTKRETPPAPSGGAA